MGLDPCGWVGSLMASTYSTRFRLNFQAPGDNINAWGTILNTGVFQLLEDAMAKRVAFTLSGTKTLTSANGAADEARCAFLDVTGGTGGTITAPSLEKLYCVRNGASGSVILTTGAGLTATFVAGEIGWAVGDGSNFRRVMLTDFAGGRITSVGDPTGAQDAATKAYVDATAFTMAGGGLPGQTGNAGKPLLTNGVTAYWGVLAVGAITGAAPSAAPSFTGGVTIAGGADFTGSTKSNVQALAAADFDLTAADFFTKSISTNTTFTFSGATASKAQAFVVELTISSSAVPTWPASVKWAGGVAPTLPNGRHILGFVTVNGGTLWTGIKSAISAA